MTPVKTFSRPAMDCSTGGRSPLGRDIFICHCAQGEIGAQRGIPSNRGETREEARKGLDLLLFIDGASRGNPGRAAAGVYITDRQGEKIAEIARYLGHKTNNEAEYGALLLGLQEAKRRGGTIVHIYTDSELVARQVKGMYRVKELHLRVLHRKVIERLKGFVSWDIESIPREENRMADLLANQAIERRIAKEKEGSLT